MRILQKVIVRNKALGLLIGIVILITAILIACGWHFNFPPGTLYRNMFDVTSALIINLCAAVAWLVLVELRNDFELSSPIHTVFPFVKDGENVKIILASINSHIGEHPSTGLGEAKALSILMDSLQKAGLPLEKVNIFYSDQFDSEDEINKILQDNHVVLLGGPNYNKFVRNVFLSQRKRDIPYVFFKDKDADGNNRYPGKIVYTNSESEEVCVIAEPEFEKDKPRRDDAVTKDCAMILRLVNAGNKTMTILAGGMSPGVWLAAQALVDARWQSAWHPRLKTGSPSEYQIVLDCSITSILTTDTDVPRVHKAHPIVHS